MNNRYLQHIKLPKSLITISESAFEGCISLNNIEIPSKVQFVGKASFQNTGIDKILIPASVQVIEKFAFSSCKYLCEIEVEYENKNFIAIENVLFSVDKTKLICFPGGYECSKYVIPEKVKSVLSGAFMGAVNLEHIVLNRQLKKIDDYTFTNCFELKYIEWSQDLQKIGKCAFMCCNGLEIVRLPKSLICIDESAFFLCESLKFVSMLSEIKQIKKEAFSFCDKIEIKISKRNPYFKVIDGDVYENRKDIVCEC